MYSDFRRKTWRISFDYFCSVDDGQASKLSLMLISLNNPNLLSPTPRRLHDPNVSVLQIWHQQPCKKRAETETKEGVSGFSAYNR